MFTLLGTISVLIFDTGVFGFWCCALLVVVVADGVVVLVCRCVVARWGKGCPTRSTAALWTHGPHAGCGLLGPGDDIGDRADTEEIRPGGEESCVSTHTHKSSGQYSNSRLANMDLTPTIWKHKYMI